MHTKQSKPPVTQVSVDEIERRLPPKQPRSHHVVAKLDHIHKIFGSGAAAAHVLKDIAFNIYAGEFLIVSGPSGSGKSTLLHTLLGLESPTRGRVILRDRNLYSKSMTDDDRAHYRREQVGMVFQQSNWIKSLKVWENVAYPLWLSGVSQSDAKEKALISLEKVGLQDWSLHFPTELSGGQQQRVALARALVSSAELIVLDEPITNLDAKLREEMAYEIRNLQRTMGVTIIYITHDQETAMTISDRMIIMDKQGYIRQLGTPEDIWNHPSDRDVYTFLGVSNFLPVRREDNSFFVVSKRASDSLIDLSIPIPNTFGDSLMLASRPMDIRLTRGSEKRVGVMQGTVERVTYLGNQFDYIIDVAGHELRVQEDSLEAFREGIPEEGSRHSIEFLSPSIYEADADDFPSRTAESTLIGAKP